MRNKTFGKSNASTDWEIIIFIFNQPKDNLFTENETNTEKVIGHA